MNKLHRDLIKIVLVCCWASLILFLIMKLFFGQVFLATTDNANFIFLSDKIENTWLRYLVSFFTIGVLNYFSMCAIAQKWYFKGKQQLLVLGLIFSIWAVSNFVPMWVAFMPFWYGMFVLVVFGLFINKGWKRSMGVTAIALQLAFTTLSIVIRAESLYAINSYLLAYILALDTMLMLIMYYLYANLFDKKEKVL